jgi:hypothetical protein
MSCFTRYITLVMALPQVQAKSASLTQLHIANVPFFRHLLHLRSPVLLRHLYLIGASIILEFECHNKFDGRLCVLEEDDDAN